MKHFVFRRNNLFFFILIFFLSPLFAEIEVIVKADKNFSDEYVNIVYSNNNYINKNLKGISGLNVINKGFSLTQTHLVINSCSFEQTGIFLDGIKFNDPQTGHFNFDLPFTLLDVEKIEISNRSSTLLGSGAFSGFVNLKLKKIKENSFEFLTEYGTYNALYTGIRLARIFDDIKVSISTEKSFSDGYHYDTDYDKQTFFISGQYKILEMQIGYDEKKFGAFDYYTPGKKMPSYEYVITRYGKIETEIFDGLKIASYIRSHSDRFTLNRDFPSFYQNQHLNLIYGGFLKYDFIFDSITIFSLKYDWLREEIFSSRLGNHHRIKNSFLMNCFLNFYENLKANLNASLENYNMKNTFDLLPSLNLIYNINENFSINPYYSYNIRYPNFTELYYVDPYNKGNDKLNPEKTNEIGITFNTNFEKVSFKITGLYKYSYDLIEWGKENLSDLIWISKNVNEIITDGINTEMYYDVFDNLKMKVIYSFLNSKRKENFISKYGFSYLKNRLVISSDLNLFDFLFTVEYEFKDYSNRKEKANFVNSMLKRKILDSLEIIFKIENLLNIYFEETKGIPAPGRILSGCIKLKF